MYKPGTQASVYGNHGGVAEAQARTATGQANTGSIPTGPGADVENEKRPKTLGDERHGGLRSQRETRRVRTLSLELSFSREPT